MASWWEQTDASVDKKQIQRGSFLQDEAEVMSRTIKGHVSYDKKLFTKASEGF